MKPDPSRAQFGELQRLLSGELHFDHSTRAIYATDASEYREMPIAVAFPRNETDLRELILFANRHGAGLIPRTAGTSLAGQVVGRGIVVDVGRHLSRILAIDAERRRARVEPGVVRNELNLALQPRGLFFGPETSTANQAMIGGMVGNNSCGSNSIVYGSTRDHLVSVRGFLSDGTMATFGPLTSAEFAAKCAGPDTLETRVHRMVRDMLGDAANRRLIRDHFPKPEVTRRNTGYALDMLMDCAVFDPTSGKPFNLCRLIAGSEGTLFLGVEFELDCDPLPPPGALMCAHFDSVQDALKATLVAMRRKPFGCELIDRHILECTRANHEQAGNRFFVVGDPGAVLVVEFRHEERARIESEMRGLEGELRGAGLGHAFPVLWGGDCDKVWELRRAGQGLVNNVVGDAKPREIVEDTAVAVGDLPDYIAEFDALMRDKYGVNCIYYAHAGAGEIHTRPLFNLKIPEGLKMFRDIATDVASLVKKYRGSLSGEHGDGRLRGEFIKFMVGDACYAMMRRVKETFDPGGVFNPGKIIDTPPMDTSLRHSPGHTVREIRTVIDFSATQGVLGAAERCTGVGDCRKSHLMGGTMCPSYMATRNEKDTTRARANLLREFLTRSPKANPFDHDELHDVLDLCLSCKGCKSECPSSVDMALLKAEFLQQYHDARGTPLRAKILGRFASGARFAARWPAAANAVMQGAWTGKLLRRILGIAPGRSLPPFSPVTLSAWIGKNPLALEPPAGVQRRGAVMLFRDEFTDHLEPAIGRAAIGLWTRLGYSVKTPAHVESARALISKGLLREARAAARENISLLRGVVSADAPLVGLEPSAILGFRDEFPLLVGDDLKADAEALAPNCLLFEEWFVREVDAGRIEADSFIKTSRTILLHGHCHQKALSSMQTAVRALSLPVGHRVEVIPSGCCGMAGSFGYEREHFDLSMAIGELVLFPAVRGAPPDAVIVVPGTSCRHQIRDGTGRSSKHPVEVLRAALRTRD